MSEDILYSSLNIDPLSSPIDKIVEFEKSNKGLSEDEISKSILDRIAIILKSRADVYKERSDQADKNNATDTAKTYIAVASELAFLYGKINSGNINDLESKPK